MPLSDNVLGWLGTHQGLLASHPFAAAYLVPQGPATPDALKIEKTLLAMHLREQRTPADFLNAVYITKGWTELQPSLLDYQAQLKEAQKTGDRVQVANLHAQWKNFTTNYGLSNPIWYADYQSPVKATSAQSALKQLQDLYQKNQLGSSNVVSGIKELLASYSDYHVQLAASTYDNGQRRTINYSTTVNSWNDYLNNLALAKPELANVISGVFKRVV